MHTSWYVGGAGSNGYRMSRGFDILELGAVAATWTSGSNPNHESRSSHEQHTKHEGTLEKILRRP